MCLAPRHITVGLIYNHFGCNSQNWVFRLCLKTSLPHHTSRFLALNEWFFAFATNGDIQFGDKFRPQCTFVARTSIHYALTLKALFVQKLVIGIWVITIKWLLIFWDFWLNKNLLNSCNKGNWKKSTITLKLDLNTWGPSINYVVSKSAIFDQVLWGTYHLSQFPGPDI